jgi:hypothetical protein
MSSSGGEDESSAERMHGEGKGTMARAKGLFNAVVCDPPYGLRERRCVATQAPGRLAHCRTEVEDESCQMMRPAIR